MPSDVPADTQSSYQAIVIGGGPAGSCVSRLLARRGHAVLQLTKSDDRSRGLAESLPPSIRKVMAAVDVLDAVDAAHFPITTGNTVWWGAREGDIEGFAGDDSARGYQVFRPDFDRLLLDLAGDAGVTICRDAAITRLQIDGAGAAVDYSDRGVARHGRAPIAVDCSGRAGVIARRGFRRHDAQFRMQAFIGVWRRESAWGLPDETHTVVETYDDGWAWSVPVADTVRHIVTMVDAATTSLTRGPTLRDTYLNELKKTRQLDALRAAAALDAVFACDASLYDAHTYAGKTFMLVGDAASTIDPL
jgi:flavin-dependent dehydrogenase